MSHFRRWPVRLSLILCVVASELSALTACADTEPGVDWYARNATAVLLAHVPTIAEVSWLPADEKDSLIIDRTIKGFDTRRYLPQQSGKLPAGQQVLVLIPFPDTRYLLDADLPQGGMVIEYEPSVWPIHSDTIDTGGVAMETTGGRVHMGLVAPSVLNRNAVLLVMADSAPEEVGLQSQMIDAVLFPDRFAILVRANPGRAIYVRLACAARDLARDVSSLSNLLESPDPAIRVAAAQHLRKITAAQIDAPVTEDSATLHLHAQAWRDWWAANHAGLIWRETKFAFVKSEKDEPRFTAPSIQMDVKFPAEELLRIVTNAIGGHDGMPNAIAFAPALRALLDDCGQRDRYFATLLDPRARYMPDQSRLKPPAWLTTTGISLDPDFGPHHTARGCLIEASGIPNCVLGGGGPFLPPAPRLRQDLLLNPNIPAGDRTALVALFAFALFNNDRFVTDRQAAIAWLARPDCDMELVRRTAFWNSRYRGTYGPNPLSPAAEDRLAQSTDLNDQNLLAQIFLQHPQDSSLDAVRHAIDAKHEPFIQGILDHLRTASGPSFDWPGRLLAQQHEARVIPILTSRLQDADATVRSDSAFNLCWIPSHDAVPDLLSALRKESDTETKNQILIAICQTDDSIALDDLLAAAETATDLNLRIELCRGLARIKNARSLPALAALALQTDNDQLRAEAVDAFGYVSGLYRGFGPEPFWTSRGVNPEETRSQISLIEKWVENRALNLKK